MVAKAPEGLCIVMVDPNKVGLTSHECFFLDLCRSSGIVYFASYPGDDLLNGYVRQIAESQPAIKHAAIAGTVLGNPYSKLYFGSGNEKAKKVNEFVMRQTSKAIRYLLQKPTPKDPLDKRAHREVVMTMCGVLAQMSMGLDQLDTYRMHVEHGQRAMQEWEDEDFNHSSIAPTLSIFLAQENCLVQMSSNPALFLHNDNPFLRQASSFCDFKMSTAEHIVSGHWHIWSYLVLRDGVIPNGLAGWSEYPDGILKSTAITFLVKVQMYKRLLKDCIEQAGFSATQSLRDLWMPLALWDQVACAMVGAALAMDESTIFKPSQMKYDAVLAYFRRINELAKKIVRSLAQQDASTLSYSVDYVVGTALFFCGFYCRDWSTRREALHLLKVLGERYKGSDALGFLPMKISALKLIIDIESHGLQPEDMVPEFARIQYVEFSGSPGSPNIRFSYRPVGMDGLAEIL